jgi:hypothetical protein
LPETINPIQPLPKNPLVVKYVYIRPISKEKKMKKVMVLIIVALFWLPAFLGAETIYTWKDKDGVLRFSNEPPPEHIKEYETAVSADTGSPGDAQSNQRRSSYDEMVDRVSKDADASREKRKQEAAA